MMRKMFVRIFFALLVIGATATVVTTNNPVKSTVQQLTQREYYTIADKGSIAHAVVCNVPLGGLQISTRQIIESNPKGVCLGGLVEGGGPPILGTAARFPVLNAWAKFNHDIQATIANDILICQVSCFNVHAHEIKSCHDLTARGAPASYSIDALNTC
jgi:hypothetical protein